MSKDHAQYLAADRFKTKVGAQRKADAALAEGCRRAVADYLGDRRTAVVALLDLCDLVAKEGKHD